MRVNCEGCAGCCLDWRPLVPDADRDRKRRAPLDDVANLVALSSDEIREFLAAGLGDVLTPRLFEPAERDDAVTIDGRAVAAIDDRPVFVVGLRKPPKPVVPFDLEGYVWLRSCVFLDPTTLQCRIHDSDIYPETCETYPGHNLALEATTECEHVEDVYGGTRLVDDEPPEDLPPPTFGPHAFGATVFAYPDPGDLDGVVDRLLEDDLALSAVDRGRFVGAAVGSRPGSLDVDRDRMEAATARVVETGSWAGRAIDAWVEQSGKPGSDAELGEETHTRLVTEIEDGEGAPGTPGW